MRGILPARLGALVGAVVFLVVMSGHSAPASGLRDRLGANSRFGIDYVFCSGPTGREQRWPRRLAETGAVWVNFSGVTWRALEPKPPSRGQHHYVWKQLDRAVTIWQQYRFQITIWLRLGDGWFAGPIRDTAGVKLPLLFKSSDRLPKPQCMDDYRAFVAALVERYDGDGRSDMPGLKYPVFGYQIGNEYGNPMFWSGTADDYITLLSATRSAARGACDKVKIISNGIRWNSFFHGNPRAEKVEERFEAFLRRQPSDVHRQAWRRNLQFNRVTLARADLCDIIDVGGNGPWPGMSEGYLRWTKRELARSGRKLPLWDMEARCEPTLIRRPASFHPELAVPGGKKILARLKNKSDPRHEETVAWYRAEQARILVKVFVARFAAGYEKVFMGMPCDWDRGFAPLIVPNPYLGLLDRDGNPWPAFYAFQSLAARIDGFRTAERVDADGRVELFRFTFNDGRPVVWVAWLAEQEPRGIDEPLPARTVVLSAVRGAARAERIPTKGPGPEPVRLLKRSPLTMELTPTPVLIGTQ